MSTDHVAASSSANADESEATRRWVVRLLSYGAVTALLAASIASPFVATALGPAWAFVGPVVGGVLIMIAVLLSPHDDVPGGRVVYWLSILSARVRQYLEVKTAARAANEHNQRRYADMAKTTADYGLSARDPALLTPPAVRPGEVAAGLTSLADIATEAVCSSSTGASLPRADALAICLRILFASHHPSSCTSAELAAAETVWFSQDPDRMPAVVEVVKRHQVFGLAGANPSTHIRQALEQLRTEGHFYELSEVVDRVSKTPTQMVKDMNTVAEKLGLRKLADRQLADVVGKASAVAHDRSTSTTAVEFAGLLSRPTDSAPLLARQLELLYRDIYDPPTTISLWSEMDDGERQELAKRLCTTDVLGSQAPRSEPIVNVILRDLFDFDIGLVRQARILIDGLLQLVDAFVEDTRSNGVTGCAKWTRATSANSLAAFLVEDKHVLPTTHAELPRLESPELAVTLVRRVAMDMIRGARSDDLAAGSPSMPKDHLEGLAFTATGLYLCGGGRRPDLARELGEQAHRPGPDEASLGDFAAKVLLARMWQRRTAIDAGRGLFIPLRALLREWPAWLDNARKDFGERLTANLLATIRQQVRHGEWPTRLPLEWQLQKFTDQIMEASGSAARTSAASIQQIKDIKHDVATMVQTADHDITGNVQLLIDKIEHFDPTAQSAEQDRMRVELAVVAEQAGVDSIEEIAQAVHELAFTDGELVRSVSDLRSVDEHLAQVVDELAQLQPSTSHRFLLTYKASSGALGPLIGYLAKPRPADGRPDVSAYDFDDEHTPYARSGRLQPDEDFDDFLDRLERDLREVCRCRKKIAPKHDWEHHDLREGVVHVQQIGRHGQHRIPSMAAGKPRPTDPTTLHEPPTSQDENDHGGGG